MTEIYKSINHLNPPLMWDFFVPKSSRYSLRDNYILVLPKVTSLKYGTNSFIFKGSYLWNTLPIEIKNSTTLNEFKTSIKKWNASTCTCSICK